MDNHISQFLVCRVVRRACLTIVCPQALTELQENKRAQLFAVAASTNQAECEKRRWTACGELLNAWFLQGEAAARLGQVVSKLGGQAG